MDFLTIEPELTGDEIKALRKLITKPSPQSKYISKIERNENKRTILRILKREEEFDKSDIIQTTGITKSVYNTIITELLKEHHSILKYNKSKKILQLIRKQEKLA